MWKEKDCLNTSSPTNTVANASATWPESITIAAFLWNGENEERNVKITLCGSHKQQ